MKIQKRMANICVLKDILIFKEKFECNFGKLLGNKKKN
jgi:hypothetical protein